MTLCRRLARLSWLAVAAVLAACGTGVEREPPDEAFHELDALDGGAPEQGGSSHAFSEHDPTSATRAGPSKPTPDPWSVQARTLKPTPDPWKTGTSAGSSGTESTRGK